MYWDDWMKWDLRKPSQVVECFYFLCALKEHIDKEIDEDLSPFSRKLDSDRFDFDFLRRRLDDWDRARESRASTCQMEELDVGESEITSEAGDQSCERIKYGLDSRRVVVVGNDVKEKTDSVGARVCLDACVGGGSVLDGQEDIPTEDSMAEDENNELWGGRTPSKGSTDSEETSSSENLTKEEICAKVLSIASWREGEQSYVFSADEARGIASLL